MAQACSIVITNNNIEMKPATCAGTVATLQGSTPNVIGGNFTYQWEKSNGNCGLGNFTAIPGATNRDYAIPSSTNAGDCFRRVVTSGLCVVPSTAVQFSNSDRTTPAVPTANTSPSSCTGTTGSITVTSPAPAAGISYSIDGVNYNNTTGVFNNLAASTYSVTVRYPAGCISPVATITINPSSNISGTISPSSATICAESFQTLTVNGGNSYQWYFNGSPISGATASTFNATNAGTYTADIIVGTCRVKSSNSATITVTPLPTGSVSPTTGSLCTSSSVTITATGGTSYRWYKNNVLISGATSSTYNATEPGVYTADIISGTCSTKSTNSATITQNGPSGSISPSTAVLCGGNPQTLTATGGGTYKWYRDGQLIPNATAATYSATQPGTYSVIITNGACTGPASNEALVTQGVSPSGFIQPANPAICPGGSVTLNAVTAGAGYTFQWFRNGTLLQNETNPTLTTTQTGNYSVVFFNGSCTGPASNVVTVAPSQPITFSTSATANPSCTTSTGTITITGVTGGSGGMYLYSRDNGANFQTSNTFPGIPTGTYQIVVRDTSGCISSPSSVTLQPYVSSLSGTVSKTDITCTQSSGSATITPSGGLGPYQFRLNNGSYQNSNVYPSLAVGNYRVTIRDAVGCTFEVNFTINQVASTLNATANITNATCGLANGSVVVTATGGAPGYTYSLDSAAYVTTNSFTNVSAGPHKVFVKDQAGCIFTLMFNVNNTGTVPNLVITNPQDICPNTTANLQLPAVTAGSDNGLVYSYWTDTTAATVLTNPTAVTAGKYFIKATNNAGCSTIKPVTVGAQTVAAGTVSPRGQVQLCRGESLVLTASAGTTYQWYRNDTLIPNARASTIRTFIDGNFSVLISNGTCAVMSKDTVRVRLQDCIPDPKVLVPTAFTPNRNGANDVMRPILYNISELRLFKVFNRWGQVVYETKLMGAGWDGTIKGTLQPSDTYTWIVEAIGKNGVIVKESGKCLLIR